MRAKSCQLFSVCRSAIWHGMNVHVVKLVIRPNEVDVIVDMDNVRSRRKPIRTSWWEGPININMIILAHDRRKITKESQQETHCLGKEKK